MTTINEDDFKCILEQLLFPLFPGTEIDNSEPNPSLPKRNRDKLVTQPAGAGGDRLKLMPSEYDSYCVQIIRSQPFSNPEKEIIRNFLIKADRIYQDWNKPYFPDTSASVMAEVVAKTLGQAEFSYKVISELTFWSQQTYEGQRIAFSIGIEPSEDPECGTNFMDIVKEDFSKVLSNGHDTLVIVGRRGQLIGHHVNHTSNAISDKYYPVRFSHIATWTNDKEGRVAITLCRNGDMLVFKDGDLLFAKRRGIWRYFAHASAIKKFSKNGVARNSSEELRKSIYLTALDIAFARTGGCIGVLNKSLMNKAIHRKKGVILNSDLLSSQTSSIKAKVISSIVGNLKFYDLDRLLRLELASIDGATVIDYSGAVVAVGAILAIPGSRKTGGGRQAATEELAKFGLGIKISNDGYIKAINRNNEIVLEIG